MFFNAEDDDDFSPSFGHGQGRSNLSSLFGADQATFNSSNNESLTYTAPKQPKKQSGKQEEASAVVHAVAAQIFKFVNGQYASQGKLGVAILAQHTKKEYRILVYASKKQQVTTAKITSNFSFVVQANNYASFYDDARQSWSIRFDTQQDVINFAKQIGLTKYNSAPGSLVKQDLQVGDGQAVETGDVLEVKYTGSLLVNNTFGKEFDSNVNADKLFKLRPGKGKVIKGWEEGVLGMKKSGKRLLVIPPALAYGDKGIPSRIPPKSTLLFEVEISRVKFAKVKQDSTSSENSSSTPTSAHNQSHEEINSVTGSVHSKDDEDLHDTAEVPLSAEKGSEKAKLLARMSKMGKNVLILPGAVAADVEDDEDDLADTSEPPKTDIQELPTRRRSQVQQVPEQPRAQVHEMDDIHSHSPGRPRVPPRSAHVNKIAHANPAPPHHVPQTPPQHQYPSDFHNTQPIPQKIPSQPQTLALYQAPQQAAPPYYQQPSPHPYIQPQPQYNPVYQQPPPPVFQPAPPVPPPSSVSSGASDVMMPMLMSESRQYQNEVKQAINKVSEKIDSIENKIEHLKKSNDENSVALKPAGIGLTSENIVEASVLMNSIVKLVQDNERLKKDNAEKTEKVGVLNDKISNLLHQSQKYVEQSNIFLEQRNESLQQSTSYSQSKLVELEREKTTLSTEVSSYKQRMATFETELEFLRQQDVENREQLQKTSLQLQRHKTELSTTKEALLERQEEVEKLSSSLKNLKQENKKVESSHSALQDAIADLKQEKSSLEKNLVDRKKKLAETKKRMDEDIEELKAGHEEEINSLKERHRRELTTSNSSSSQQLSQLETEIEEKWQDKSKQMVTQCERKWQRKYDEIVDENETLKKKLIENDDKHSSIKTSQKQHLQKIDELQEQLRDKDELQSKCESLKEVCRQQKQELEKLQERLTEQSEDNDELREKAKELKLTQNKYEDLKVKSVEMKETYKTRIEELEKEKESAMNEIKKLSLAAKATESLQKTDAPEPSREKIVTEVKQIMNKVFFQIREKFVPSDNYNGSTVVSVVLNIVKSMTLKMTSGVDDESDEDEEESENDDEESENEEEQSGDDEDDDEERGGNKEGVEGNVSDSGKKEKTEVNVASKKEEIIVKESEKDQKDDVQNVVDDFDENKTKNDDKIVEENDKAGKVDTNFEELNEKEVVRSLGNGDGKEPPTNSNNSIEEKALVAEDVSPTHGHDSEPPVISTDNIKDNTLVVEDESSIGGGGNGLEPPANNTDSVTDDISVVEEKENIEDTSNIVKNSDDENDYIHSLEVPPLEELESSNSGKEDQPDNYEQSGIGDPKVSLVSHLPNVEGLSGDNENRPTDLEVENKESESTTDDSKVEHMKDEVEGSTDVKKGETKVKDSLDAKSDVKKNQTLSEFLSDDEDDVEGLFDGPPLKTKHTPPKKDETPTMKAIPPPLFDDDDDDDLDWFS